MNDVHELLGRAADDAGTPALSTGTVYARAARIRRRRRALVSAAALTVVAAGALTVARAGEQGDTAHSSVATTPRPSGSPASSAPALTKAERLAALLPPDAGKIEQVLLLALTKQIPPEQAKETYLGPLDGQYAFHEDGGVGYLVLNYEDREAVTAKEGRPADPDADLCPEPGQETSRTECVREVLPDGRVLTLWNSAMPFRGGDDVRWGPELTGQLVQRDGSRFLVRSSTGFESTGTQGPLLDEPPVSREQLKALLTGPEVLPEKP
ncbi:hypothetical protein PV390_33160 [Streptomyces sp. ME02-6991-2A]|uniref:hypothetical protein n=1 Tax=Streptomyces sp. ME02-6991-2A TaxID=3028677 RepID=UPI0029A27079|nr:hypothetical protein [Streptomyces sp. ME02-6991-2A]MDX3379251.1 hypothetical protein [Streptomyces sp. ME02-6991-2A]